MEKHLILFTNIILSKEVEDSFIAAIESEGVYFGGMWQEQGFKMEGGVSMFNEREDTEAAFTRAMQKFPFVESYLLKDFEEV